MEAKVHAQLRESEMAEKRAKLAMPKRVMRKKQIEILETLQESAIVIDLNQVDEATKNQLLGLEQEGEGNIDKVKSE